MLSEFVFVKELVLVKVEEEELNFLVVVIVSCGVMMGYGFVVNVVKL